MTDTNVKNEAIRLLDGHPFHFKAPVGLLFPIIQDGDGQLAIKSVPVHNDWSGEADAKKIENRPDFYAWAVNPRSGEVNPGLEFETPSTS